MSKVWLTQHTFDTLMALSRNYRIRMSSNVKTPAVAVSGTGKRACVNILLPTSAAAGYNGNFKVTLNEKEKLEISSGFLNRNGEFLPIPSDLSDPPDKSGYLCLCSTIEEGKWTKPEFRIAEPAADAYPIAEITVEEKDGKKNIYIRQFPVNVAIILLAKRCPLTTGVPNA
ncbi:MAG: hypothetical protein PHI35_08780 [Victivallaceae bacterium]|nr:hypothetical protein [Victivallaceae bacterium]